MKRTLAVLLVTAGCLLLLMVGLGLLDVHVLAHGSVGHLDRATDQTLARHRDHLLNSVTFGATSLAATTTVIVAAFLVFVAARLVFKRWREALFVVTVMVGEVSIFTATTFIVHRPRPQGVEMDHAPPTSSFPSGHTAASVALWGTIAILVARYGARVVWGRIALALAIAVPLIVAASRLYRGMHFLTDVLAGAVLGAAWLLAATRTVLGATARPAGEKESPAHHGARQVALRGEQ